MTVLGTRAVLADVPAGNNAICPGCNKEIRYDSTKHPKRVLCNVYRADKWDRYEEYHAHCYVKAGSPHGPLTVRDG